MDTLPNNGVLTRVLADEIARAMRTLPPADGSQPETLGAQADASLLGGEVRITFRLKSHVRGKTRYYFWTAFHAELLTGGQQNS